MKRSSVFSVSAGALVAIALVLGSNGTPAQAAAASDATRQSADAASRGKSLYQRQGCYQCHGLVGQGSIITGPRLSPLRLDSAQFRGYVRSPRGSMPPFTTTILSDADLALIEAFVRSLPPPPTPSTIPLLAKFAMPGDRAPLSDGPNAARSASGSVLYLRVCSGCHGAGLEGGIGPDLRNEAAKRDVAGIVQIILAPPANMPRLHPSELSRDEVEAIATYVHSRK